MSETASTDIFARRLYILAGVPGCGKSSWAQRFFHSYQVVSSDAIREQICPGPYDHSRNAEVFGEFHRRIDEFLPSWDVVADATSLTPESRTKLRLLAKKHGAECHLVFFNNLGQALERNATRDRDPNVYDWVPHEAMEFMVKRFHQTKAAIIDEEYTSITSIEGTYATATTVEPAATAAVTSEPDSQKPAVSA